MRPSILKRVNPLWLLLAALIPLYLTWTFDHSLWNPDETRDAGIAAEMFRAGTIAVPTLNGDAFLEKPPLYYWTCAAVYKITGRVSAGTTRLPSALYGILGVFLTFLIGRRLLNARAAFFAAALLATSAQYFRMSHFALMDVCLAALVTAAIYFYLRGSRLGFAACTVLAFFAKGFLGVVLPGIVVTIDLTMQRRFKDLAKTIGLGAIVFAVLTLPWFWALWKQGGRRYLEIFLIDNHWKRFSSATGDHTEHPWFFYFLSFPGDFLPATLAFAGFAVALARAPRAYLERPNIRFLVLWFLSLFAFFCVSSSKRSIYLLPIFPAASLLSGAWIDERLSRRSADGEVRGENTLAGILGALAALVVASSVLVTARLDRDKTFVPFVEAVRANQQGRKLIGFDMSEMERGVIGFYLRGTFVNVRTIDELKAAIGDGPSLVMVNRTRQDDVAAALAEKFDVVFTYRPDKSTRSFLLYATRRPA